MGLTLRTKLWKIFKKKKISKKVEKKHVFKMQPKNGFFGLQNIIVRNASEEIKTMDLQRKNQPHLL